MDARIEELLAQRTVDAADDVSAVTLGDVEVQVESRRRVSEYAKSSETTETVGIRYGEERLAYEVETTVRGSRYTDASWRDDALYEEDLTPEVTGRCVEFGGRALYRWHGNQVSKVWQAKEPGLGERILQVVGISEPEPNLYRAASDWADDLLTALGLPPTPQAFQALCDRVLFPVCSRTPPEEASERLCQVFVVITPRSMRVREQLSRWYAAQSARASAAADAAEGGRTTDAALDAGGIAHEQIAGPADRRLADLSRKIQEAERLLSRGEEEGGAALLAEVEQSLSAS